MHIHVTLVPEHMHTDTQHIFMHAPLWLTLSGAS